jgi:hypothetical protein
MVRIAHTSHNRGTNFPPCLRTRIRRQTADPHRARG